MNAEADRLLRAKFAITWSQFLFLVQVAENSPLDVTRLALALGVTKGAISKRLSWFAERGMAQTHQLEGDSKRVFISLTKSGQKLATAAADFLESEFLATLATAPEVDYKILSAEVAKVTQLFLEKASTNKL